MDAVYGSGRRSAHGASVPRLLGHNRAERQVDKRVHQLREKAYDEGGRPARSGRCPPAAATVRTVAISLLRPGVPVTSPPRADTSALRRRRVVLQCCSLWRGHP